MPAAIQYGGFATPKTEKYSPQKTRHGLFQFEITDIATQMGVEWSV